MPIPSRQIGWSTQDNLLWQVAKQLEGASCQICTTNELIGNLTGAIKAYGSFYDMTDQTGPAATILAMKLGNTDTSATNGISIVNDGNSDPTQITVSQTGVYDIQFSAQMIKDSGNSATRATIWIRKNGIDVPDSATYISFPGNSVYIVAAWNWFIQLNAGEYAQLMWHIDSNVDNGLLLAHESAGVAPVHPAVPSLIVTVNKIN
jgi:hypothetical protein